jgi:hypothetical protein
MSKFIVKIRWYTEATKQLLPIFILLLLISKIFHLNITPNFFRDYIIWVLAVSGDVLTTYIAITKYNLKELNPFAKSEKDPGYSRMVTISLIGGGFIILSAYFLSLAFSKMETYLIAYTFIIQRFWSVIGNFYQILRKGKLK